MKNKNYSEGTIFAVPLKSKGYLVGVVARTSKAYKGSILGYFFGKKYKTVPTIKKVDGIDPAKAIKIYIVIDVNLINNKWPIIGKFTDWDRTKFPMPYFVRKDPILEKAKRIKYSEVDLSKILKEWPEPYNSKLEESGICSAIIVEEMLLDII